MNSCQVKDRGSLALPCPTDMRRHPSLLATEFHDRSSAWPVQALLFDRLASTPDRAARWFLAGRLL